jgi:hypothetical protein
MSALANNFKTKFAGLLRGMLRRVDGSEVGEPQTTRPVTTSAPLPTAPAPVTAASQPLPAVAPAPYSPVPAQVESVSELEMPLLPILEKLPPDLRSKSITGGVNLAEANICISVEKVLPQLAQGTVKITFGELRSAAPNLFRTGEEYDSLPIVLPLNDVLSRLNPALLARHLPQRTISAPSEISGPFGAGAQVAFTTAPLKPTPPTTHFFRKAPPSPEQAKIPMPTPVAPPPPFSQRSAAPAPHAPAAPTPLRANTPVPIQQIPSPARAPMQPSAAASAAASIPALFPTPKAPVQPPTPAPIPATPRAPVQTPPPAPIPFLKPVTPAMTAPPAAPVPAMPSAAPVPAMPAAASGDIATILVPLRALAEAWPETLRQEIVQMNLINSQVALPVHLIEPALKRGRVIFSWHNLRSWLRPTPPGPSVHDNKELELSLKVIAPLFLPRQNGTVNQRSKATTPPSSVPNLFFGFPQPQPEELAPPVNVPDLVPPPKPVDARMAETNFYVWGDGNEAPRVDETDYKRPATPATDFTSRRAMPQDIIERAMQLPNMAGAIIALPDGLKVAHHLPSELNADTVAAFLPQLFSRVSQCSKELRMGELNNLNFTIGNIPWKIFRVNAVYFAAFGRAGEPLPTAQLAVLAGELDRKK